MYNATGTTISLYMIQGKLDIIEACVSSELKK